MGREKGSLDFGTVRIAEKERGTDNTNYPRDDLQRGRENGEGKAKNEQIYGTPGLAELSRFLEQWRTEWANKNFSGLMDLYDPAYRVGPVDFETLKRRKRAALNQYERIDVQLQDILSRGKMARSA